MSRVRCLIQCIFAAVLLLVLSLAGVAAGADIAGRYEGENLTLVLAPDAAAAGSYTGTITLRGKDMPARLTTDPAKGLQGSFESEGQSFPFSLREEQDRFILTSGTARFSLKRKDAPGANAARPPQNAPPEAAGAGGGDGYLGLVLRTGDAQLRVKVVAPGGPGENAGIRADDVILEIDGKPVRGDDPQLAGLTRGPVGSTAKLLLLRDGPAGATKVLATVTREAPPAGPTTPLPGQGPGAPPPAVPVGPAVVPQQPNLPPGGAAPAAVPALLKVGTRLAYEEGQSIVHNVDFHLVPVGDDKFRAQEDKNSGGVGYRTIDILHVSGEFVAADSRSWQIVDVQTGRTTVGAAAGLAGNANGLGIYWKNPARLAALAQGRDGDLTINRVRYELNGRTYNAISILTDNDKVYDSQIFDLETGLMLATSRKYQGDPVAVPVGGKLGKAKGPAVIEHSRFVSTRELNLPWANEPTPDWVAKGRVLNYQGTYSALIPNGTPITYATTRQCTFNDVVNGCLMCTTQTRKDIGPGLPVQESTDKRIFASAMLDGLWISPKAVQQLRPNQVIDDDRVTRFRTTFMGVRGNVAVFVDQGMTDQFEFNYDTTTGMLVGVRFNQQTPPVGQIQTEYRFVGQQ